MRSIWVLLAGLLVTPLLVAGPAFAGEGEPVAKRGCAALAGRVNAVPGSGPAFLASYDGVEGEPALNGAAFTYDNALAAIALVACGRVPEAHRIGDALLAAATSDRADRDARKKPEQPGGRLRNAYRAGPLNGIPQPHGWWDAAGGHWAEDPMAVGTATGNVAWAGLALLTVAEATGDARFADGARTLATWATRHTWDRSGGGLDGGFTGGIHGDGAVTRMLGWKSTEHNVDLAALFGWLARRDAYWTVPTRAARDFVAAAFDNGHFLTGTLPDGHSPNRATSGLDAQLWPLLLEGAPVQWRTALDYARRAHGVDGGFDFNDDRDGIWWEGTAQAALALAAVGEMAAADAVLARLAGQFSPGGLIWATSVPRLTTGLALAPDSREADFFYYRRPHLGATAWAVLAARRWNPFTGKRLG
ncbi:MAG TPA: hypothetical protein VL974_00065 [Magnetospirillum sp.]|jgi:hypothetical protein|nr:hypothetical protein [Magnetospirillum sp.]